MSDVSEGVATAMEYLADGGLGEVMGFSDLAKSYGTEKVIVDTDIAIALCILADEALKERAARRAVQ